jgi:hypothetical protein
MPRNSSGGIFHVLTVQIFSSSIVTATAPVADGRTRPVPDYSLDSPRESLLQWGIVKSANQELSSAVEREAQ